MILQKLYPLVTWPLPTTHVNFYFQTNHIVHTRPIQPMAQTSHISHNSQSQITMQFFIFQMTKD